MSNITFHRHHMTAIPTDLLLNPTISIEAKAFAGILRAISEGSHRSEELAILLNVPEDRDRPWELLEGFLQMLLLRWKSSDPTASRWERRSCDDDEN